MSAVQVSSEEKKFLLNLIDNNVSRLEPKTSPQGVIYNELETDGKDWKQIFFYLKSLAEKGFLNEEDYDRAIFCPTCDSPHVYSKYACPQDRSIFVRRLSLLRHTTDGYQGLQTSFEKDGRLICPKCSDDLGDVHNPETRDSSLTEIGFTFECIKSGHRFERPLVLHYCPDCGSLFDYKTAKYVPLYAYTLTQKAYDFAKADTNVQKLVGPIIDFLESEGLSVGMNAELKGTSGSDHRFDLLASYENRVIVFDYSFGDSNKLVALLGKKLDLFNVEAVLIDFSGVAELMNLGKVYNIPIVSTVSGNWKKTLQSTIYNIKAAPPNNVQRRNLWRKNIDQTR